MALYDELEGLLGAEAVAKLTPELRSKMEFGEQLTSYYNGDTEEVPVRQPARAATPPVAVVTTPAASGLSVGLDEISRLLDTKLGDVKTLVTTTVDEAVKARGSDLVNNAISISMRNTRELARADQRHEKDFGEPLDDTKFNTFVEEEKKKGHTFTSVSDAYDGYTRDRYTTKKIEDGVREGLKTAKSGEQLPGVTPQATRGPVAILQSRRANDGGAGGDTAVSRAAKALQERMATSSS